MKWIIFSAVLFVSCSNSEQNADTTNDTANVVESKDTTRSNYKTPQIKKDSVIIAGDRIGKVQIGADASNLESILGKPSQTDAAMGKAWMTWQGKPDEHNNQTEMVVYTAYKDNNMTEKIIKLISTTSEAYATQEGVHVYSSLEDIQKAFPAMVKLATYKHQDGRDIAIYASKAMGIAFETVTANEQTICTSVIVYERGTELQDIYRMKHQNLAVEGANQST